MMHLRVHETLRQCQFQDSNSFNFPMYLDVSGICQILKNKYFSLHHVNSNPRLVKCAFLLSSLPTDEIIAGEACYAWGYGKA